MDSTSDCGPDLLWPSRMDKRISVLLLTKLILVLNDNLLSSNHNLSNDVSDTASDNIGLTVVVDATDLLNGIIWTILQDQFIP